MLLVTLCIGILYLCYVILCAVVRISRCRALNNPEYDDDNNWPAPPFTAVEAVSPHTLSPTLSSTGPNLSQELSVLGMLGLTPDSKNATGQAQFQPIPDIALPESKVSDVQLSPSARKTKKDEAYRQRWSEEVPEEAAMAWGAGRGMVPTMVPAALLPFIYNPMYAQLLAHWQAGGLPFPYDERGMKPARPHNFENRPKPAKTSREASVNPAPSRSRTQNTYSFVDGVLVVTDKDGNYIMLINLY